jgi:glycosyltransferase involved in cell wall biosynthesis
LGVARERINPITVIFIGFVGRNYSRSSTILNFETSHLTKKYFEIPANISLAFISIVKNRAALRDCSAVVVMSPCHMLTPLIRFIVRKPVILDAGWALTDGELSRGIKGTRLFKLPLIYLTDLIAFTCSKCILVETNLQINRIHNLFGIRKHKLRVSLTGINELDFAINLTPSMKIQDLVQKATFKSSELKILFRGKINRESGFDSIIKAALESGPELFFIFVIGGKDKLENLPVNAVVFQNLSNADLKEIYALSDICIGQFSTHPRLSYTIPHKAFEAAYFGKPYITVQSPGIRDFLSVNDAVFVEKPTSENLIHSIRRLSDSNRRSELGANILKTYGLKSSQHNINQDFEKIVLDTIGYPSYKDE